MEVSLRLLGVPAVRIADRSEPLGAERRFQLLAYLALHDAWITRERLAHLFWPDRNEELARGNLRFTLAQIRKLPWLSGLEVRADALRWTVETDVARFEHALATDPSAAIDLYGGPLLTGFETNAAAPFVEWLSAERRRLHGRWRDAVIARLTAEPPAAVSSPSSGITNQGGADERPDLVARLLHDDPLDELALQVYVRLLRAHGRDAEAQRAYRDFTQRLSEELGIEPSAQTRALLREGGRPTAPTVRAELAAAAPGDPDFVGRAVERRELAALLAREDVRLVTLLGPGGVGKSALAQRVAGDAAPRFADGAHFVALEDVPEAEGIGARIARELALTLHGTAPPIDQVTAYLSVRCTLLVLDNFEHLAHSAPLLQDLLQRCPRLKLLVTSRIRLGLAEETVFPIDGLPCPSAEDDHRATDFDAVRLFIDRARQIRPAFDAQAQIADIAEICRRVDGLPLALELAAPWIRLLSCREIAAEIRAGTELLQAQDPTRPARQASIEATLAHSWRLLMPAERDALARLSVFRGGFTREAAREVAGASLPVLGSLVDKSLIQAERSRFSLHPLIQEFAESGLRSTAEWKVAKDRHASYFEDLLIRAGAMRGKDEPRSVDLIETELQNTKAAWLHALASSRVSMLRGATALGRYYNRRSELQRGIDLLKAAEAAFPAAHSSLIPVWLQLAPLEYLVGQLTASRAHAKRALAAARAEGDWNSVMIALFYLGHIATLAVEREAAVRYFSAALKAAERIRDEMGIDVCRGGLARALRETGDFERAEELFRESLQFRKDRGDRWRTVDGMHSLGILLTQAGRAAEAVAVLSEALALCAGDDAMNFLLCGLKCAAADARLRAGDPAAARMLVEEAICEFEGKETPLTVAELHFVLAKVSLSEGRLSEARHSLAKMAQPADPQSPLLAQLACLFVFGVLQAALGELNEAKEVLSLIARHPSSPFDLVRETRESAGRFGIALDARRHDPIADATALAGYMARVRASARLGPGSVETLKSQDDQTPSPSLKVSPA